MAAAVTLLARERRCPRIACQVLFCPVTDARGDTASYAQFAEGPWLTRKTMAWFWDSYAPDAAVRAEPTASPLRATCDQLTGLPPALVITAEADVVRDEGEAYAHRLLAAGVPVTAVRYLGAIHDFVLLAPLAQSWPARAAIAQATAALRAAFAH
jgi:acetyl esterase